MVLLGGWRGLELRDTLGNKDTIQEYKKAKVMGYPREEVF